MRGGVSLAVWIGGAVAEVDHFRRASDGADFYSKLLDVGRYNAVEVDVMSGASAGGLNAVLAASAMLHGRSVSEMRSTWLNVAGLKQLLDDNVVPGAEAATARRRSLLDGHYFKQKIVEKIVDLYCPVPADPERPTDDERRLVEARFPLRHRLDIFLSATVLDGQAVQIVDDDFSQEQARRSGALFRFRHFGDHETVSELKLATSVDDLATAARTTASFPTAFEPMEFGVDALRGRLQLPGTVEPLSLSGVEPKIWLLDGGVVDNIPVARALQGLPNIPARTVTDRWLVYMQPSPDVITPVTSDSRHLDHVPGFGRTLKGILGGFMSESILDDVEVIRRHNGDAIESWKAWSAQVGLLPEPDRIDITDRAYTATDAAVDATRIMGVLLNPTTELLWRPVDWAVPPSPLGTPSLSIATRFRLALQGQLAPTAVKTTESAVRPFAALARSAAMLTRWARLTEEAMLRSTATATSTSTLDLTGIGNAKIRAYHNMQLAQLLTAIVDRVALESAAAAKRDAAGVIAAMSLVVRSLRSRSDIAFLTTKLPLPDRDLASGAAGSSDVAPIIRHLYGKTSEDAPDRTASAVQIDPTSADVVDLIWSALGEVASELSSVDVTDVPGADPVLVQLAERIRRDDASAITYLRLIDRHTVGVHHGIAAGQASQVNFVQIGGSNLSPMCIAPRSDAEPDGFDYDGPRFEPPMRRTGNDVLAPRLKLAGGDLANFSAFISEKWRANDWMWGRMDAVKSMVDIVTSRDRLPTPEVAFEAIRGAVAAPFSVGDPPSVEQLAWLTQLESWRDALWQQYESTIREELDVADEATGEHRLLATRRVLVLRRHWEIIAEELPVFVDASLEPVRVRTDRSLEHSLVDQVAAYQRSPRSIGDVWGEYWLTALGIDAAYSFWSATRPRSRLKQVLRAPFKPIPMSVLGTVLVRNRGLFALALAFNVVLVPRLKGFGGWFVWSAALVAAGVCAARFGPRTRTTPGQTRRRWFVIGAQKAVKPRLHDRRYERFGMFAAIAAVLSFVFGFVVRIGLIDRWLRTVAWPNEIFGWTFTSHFDHYSLLAAGAGAVATWLLWHWARLGFRALAAVVVAAITGFWAVFSEFRPGEHHSFLASVGFEFGSMWWAFLACVGGTTTIAHAAFFKRWPIARWGSAASNEVTVGSRGAAATNREDGASTHQ